MAKILGHTPADRWERVVCDELRQQLPDDWLVIAGVSWTRRGPQDSWQFVRDGQADIVVLAPNVGMIVVEVKGSRGFRIDEDGCWYRHDVWTKQEVRLDESPAQQATRNMHELVDIVEARGTWGKFPGRYAYVVVYPQGKLVGSLPACLDASTLIAACHRHELLSRLRLAVNSRGPESWSAGFDVHTVSQIADLLTGSPFAITKVDTEAEVSDDTRAIERLTQQQFAALQGIFRLPSVAVTGPAGSGKTVLAIWQLQVFQESGKKALYLCFNKDLAQSLRRRHPELQDSIDNVDRRLRRIAENAGRLPSQAEIESDVSGFFRESLPWLVAEILDGVAKEQKFDAVIIDEGQDFSDAQVLAALSLRRNDDSNYTFFADWKQDVFRQASGSAIGADVVFSLRHNCRNTERINARTNELLSLGVESMPGVPVGTDPIVEYCSSNGMAARAWKLASEWSKHGKGVVILSPYSLHNSCMFNSKKGHGMSLVNDIDDFGLKDTVYFSTIRSFKGIEARSVIVVDVDSPNSSNVFRDEDLYVACTRATARLAFLCTSKEAADWFKQT